MYINAVKNPLLYIHVIWFVLSKEHAYLPKTINQAPYEFVQK